jgi:[ribosomal protein S5]-alanine N-acetyltransferase
MIYQLEDEYYVRSFCETDLDGPYRGWFEDQEVCRFNSHGKLFRNEQYYRAFWDSLNRDDQLVWAICHCNDGHIGNISLQEISAINRNAEFAILIADKRHWGRGVGKLAGLQLLHHGFDKLNLERVYCGTAQTNTGMRRLALALGMREEGCRRAHLWLDGAWMDMIEYGILRNELQRGSG